MRARMPTRSVDTAVPKRDAVATNPISTELKGVDAVPPIHDSVRSLAPNFQGVARVGLVHGMIETNTAPPNRG
jgi:hypothetical protein